MIDPWERFLAQAESAECAGYFESCPDRSGPGRATFFVGAREVRTVTAEDSLRRLDASAERFLRPAGRRAVAGYLSFEAAALAEPLLGRYPRGSPFPLGEFAFVDAPMTGSVPPRRVPRAEAEAGLPAVRPLTDSLGHARFSASVRRLKRAILDGEAFQVVLAHRRGWPRPPDLLARAGRLRDEERYRYFFYLRFGDREVVGASPESVVEVAGARACLHPIAGTRPLGTGERRRLPLHRDAKELAEHRMLVDLARNDLGRVCRPGTVRVAERERRERFRRLEHLVSRVEGTLRAGVGPFTLLGATFPAGTVSGAPKVRATQLLRREESTWRGPYAGAVGLLGRGRASWALTIRSGFATGNRLFTAAGAGIVHLSQPRREWEETLAKLAEVESVLVGPSGP